MLKKKKEGLARMHRKSILDQKRAKGLKSMHKGNASPSDIIHDKEVSHIRFPLSGISPNIPSHIRGISSCVQHSLPNSVLNTLPSTIANIR